MSAGTERSRVWVPALGLGAVVVFVALTVAAVSLYPASTSPVDIFLSDLGNAHYSPRGWLLFDVAMIAAGLLAIPFYVGVWRCCVGSGLPRLLRTALVAGIVNGLAVAMAGVVAEHVHLGAHIGWSLLIFVSFLPLLLAYGLVLWRRGGFSRAVGAYGFAVCLTDLGLLAALFVGGPESGPGSLMEWVAVFAYLAWVGLVSVDLLVTKRPRSLSS